MARFDDCLAIIFSFEGGISNDPADRGGLTNYGITQGTYDSWRHAQGLPQQPVSCTTQSEAGLIYQADYWGPAKCPVLPQPVDLCVFDTAVNSGVSRAGKLLQCAANVTPVDGVTGPLTLAAVSACDPGDLAARYLAQRETFVRGIVATSPVQGRFLNGWIARINVLRHICGVPGF